MLGEVVLIIFTWLNFFFLLSCSKSGSNKAKNNPPSSLTFKSLQIRIKNNLTDGSIKQVDSGHLFLAKVSQTG